MFKTKTILKIVSIFLGLTFLLGFFVWPNFSKPTRANNEKEVVINEIMWMGSSLSPTDEWLELRNLTDDDIDFSKTNWKIYKNDSSKAMVTINQGVLYANNYFLIAQKSKEQSILNIDPDLIASSSFSLNNGDVQYKLYDGQNNLIDIADDGVGDPLAGLNSTNIRASMERNLNPGDGTLKENWHTAAISTNFDFNSTELGTPKVENSRENQAPKIILVSVSPTSVVADGQSVVKFQTQIQDPDGENDINQVIIDLSKIGGQSEKMNNLGQGNYDYQFIIPISTEAKKYEIPITVSDNSGNIVEDVVFLDITSPVYSDKIIINEIYPNPSDQNTEFIELKNLDAATVDLKDWRIADKSTSYKIKTEDFLPISTLIAPTGFLVVPKSKSGISLNNTGGETVSLVDPNSRMVFSISYSESAPENESFALFLSGWSWTNTVTSGAENVLSTPLPINHNPKAVAGDNKKAYVDESVTFDGADSYDPDNDALAYTWDLGDKTSKTGAVVTHKYKKAGKYTAKLKVEDGRGGTDEDTVLVTISEKKKAVTKKTTKKETKKSTKKSTKKEIIKKPKGPFSRRIVVTEIMPNPTGSDAGESGKEKTGEWIEIKNNEKHEVNLSYWQIDDAENNDTPTTLQNVKIKPGRYLVFYYAALKVNLNNDKDEVRILDPDGKVAYKVNYSGSKEGLSYAIDEKTNKWYWTQKPTPEKANIIDLIVKKPTKKIDDDEEDTDYDDDEFDIIDDDEDTNDTEETTDNETTDLSDVMEMDNGEEVRVKGWVSSAPGIFGKDIFYMQDSTGGMQIYFSKADFPKLAAGDIVSVTGKVSSLAGEKKINVSQKSDIKFMSHSSAPKPEEVEMGEIDDSYMGQLISTTGTIAKKIGQNLYLENAGEQIRVYLEKGISLGAEISKGREIMVAGVLSQTKAGLRILPRNKSDVALAKAGAKTTSDGEQTDSETTATNSAQVGNSLGKIILFSILATGVVAALLFLKKRKII